MVVRQVFIRTHLALACNMTNLNIKEDPTLYLLFEFLFNGNIRLTAAKGTLRVSRNFTEDRLNSARTLCVLKRERTNPHQAHKIKLAQSRGTGFVGTGSIQHSYNGRGVGLLIKWGRFREA